MIHGWIVLDKPLGLGSTKAVSRVKRALREAGEPKTKVGHGGTLDPLASGVLPMAIGEATKVAGRMLDATKAYDFTIAFGEETDTLDAEGEVVAKSDIRPTREQVEAVLPRFRGAIEQIPPAYSALKVEGKAAYARSRAGEAVELKPRQVTIHSLKLLPGTERGTATRSGLVEGAHGLSGGESGPLHHAPHGPPPRPGEDFITLSATVSKGTYIRSLARDIAHALGTVGHVSYLRRTRAGSFGLESAISLDFLDELAKARDLTRAVLPLEAALDDIPALPVTPDQARLLRHGQRLGGFPERPGLQLATSDTIPVALVEAGADGLKVVRGFNFPDVAE
ncbi:MAG TPA: tRNA pseudouridine(55) synthase TruB [Sphingomicrobium sp.]|nr:tRNA pseudouridine(55) synthase TruB [Sphingomicrobium sp.]